jgi:hypothetical protein
MEENDKVWKHFVRNHWKMLVVFIVVAIIAVLGAIYVLLWFVEDAQVTGLVPYTLNLWSMGYLITFLVHLIFWELVVIGIPVAIAAGLLYFIWWKQIPQTERDEYRRAHLFGKRSKRHDGQGAISFLIFVFFALKVHIDGNWGVAFATWDFDYLIYSWLWALMWIAIIFGIPLVIGGIWWIYHQMNKKT